MSDAEVHDNNAAANQSGPQTGVSHSNTRVEAPDNHMLVSRTNSDLEHSNALTLALLRVRLFDPFLQPIANAPYRLTFLGQMWEDTADGDGWAEHLVQSSADTCHIEWNYPHDSSTSPRCELPPGDPGFTGASRFIFSQQLRLDHMLGDDNRQMTNRFQNLGYTVGSDPALAVKRLQVFYDRPTQGESDVNQVRADLTDWHDTTEPTPLRRTDTWRLMV